MPKSESYGRPSNRSTKKVAEKLTPSKDPNVTLNAAHARKRRDNDILDKMPSLGKRKK